MEKHRFYSWKIHEFVVATFLLSIFLHQYLPLDNFPRPKGSTAPPPFSQTTNYLALKSAFWTNQESKITRVRKFFSFFDRKNLLLLLLVLIH